MSVIETMSAGYGAVARRPWIILLPLALDLFLWLGPRLSAGPVFDRLARTYSDLAPSTEQAGQLSEMAQQLGSANLFVLLAWQVPGIVLGQPGDGTAVGGAGELVVSSGAGLLLIALGLLVGGLVLSGIYLTGVAEIVDRTGRPDGLRFLRQLGPGIGRLLLFALLVAVIGFFVGVPLLLVLALVSQVSPELGSFLGTIIAVLVIWLWVYLFFAAAALFVRQRGPVAAIRESIGIVSRHFWSTLWLFFLIQIITVGIGIAWTAVLTHPIGLLIAMFGSAFIATGLTAAWMLFYQERSGPVTAVAPERAESRRSP